MGEKKLPPVIAALIRRLAETKQGARGVHKLDLPAKRTIPCRG